MNQLHYEKINDVTLTLLLDYEYSEVDSVWAIWLQREWRWSRFEDYEWSIVMATLVNMNQLHYEKIDHFPLTLLLDYEYSKVDSVWTIWLQREWRWSRVENYEWSIVMVTLVNMNQLHYEKIDHFPLTLLLDYEYSEVDSVWAIWLQREWRWFRVENYEWSIVMVTLVNMNQLHYEKSTISHLPYYLTIPFVYQSAKVDIVCGRFDCKENGSGFGLGKGSVQ